jgi:dTDP-4-dehydrorhamnose reductase
MSLKILLLGKDGQVGHELCRTLPALGGVVALDRPEIDFERPDMLAELVRREAPDVIVNAAAYTAVDRAEAEPDRARLVNADAVAALAAAADRLGGLLVHYSTDYVFDGTKAGPYVETDAPAPLGVYGATKLAGERAAAAAGRHYVLRTSWVHGVHGANFVRTMLRLAREREELRVVDDQTGAPTSASLLAEVTAALIGRATRPASSPATGVYHLVPRGHTTWHGFARFILERARDRGLPLRVQPEAVQPIPSSAYPTPARRPHNSRLDTAKIAAALGITLPAWQDDAAPVVDALADELLSSDSTAPRALP